MIDYDVKFWNLASSGCNYMNVKADNKRTPILNGILFVCDLTVIVQKEIKKEREFDTLSYLIPHLSPGRPIFVVFVYIVCLVRNHLRA